MTYRVHIQKQLLTKTFLFVISLQFLFLCFHLFNLKINVTSSINYGIYKLNEIKSDIHSDQYVLFCIDPSLSKHMQANHYLTHGSCSTLLSPIGKKIVAVPGDDVSISEKGIFVNNTYIVRSEPLKTDTMGRKLNAMNLRKRLDVNEYIVVSSKRNSYDSRYFGIVKRENILGEIKEIITL